MSKRPLTLFVIYTSSTEPDRANPICRGLSMSTGTVGETLNRDEVIDAVEESGQYRNDELLDDLCDAHQQYEIIATCYDRGVYLKLLDVLTPMLIDDRFDDERRFKSVHASTLRKAAFGVLHPQGDGDEKEQG